MSKSEKLIFARGKWEFARVEINSETGKPQWIRRDFSYICNVGDEIAATNVPPNPKRGGVAAIKDSDIEHAATIADIDEALGGLEAIANVEDGGIAAQVFSEMEDQTAEWAAMSPADRIVWINRWIKTERLYEKD